MKSRLVFLSLAVLLQPLALAVTPDYIQHIKIESDNLDSKNENVLIYSDNVVISQGSILINADVLEIDASAGKGKEIYSVRGTPVRYSQQLEDGKTVNAFASEMRYEPANRSLTLNGDAELTQSGSVVKASTIKYNVQTQELNAASDNSRRVTTIITPEKEQ